MTARKISIKLLISVLIIIFVFNLYHFFNTRKIDTSLFSNIYSNGWHEYSFKYPSDYFIEYSLGAPNREVYGAEGEIPNEKIGIMVGPKGSGKGTICTLAASVINEKIKDYESHDQIELGGIMWKKQKYISNKGDWMYEYKGINWQTENRNFSFLFQSHQDDERICEVIISTFQNRVDPSINAAVEAKIVKDKAMAYASTNYPNKIFVEGHFLYDTRTGQKLNVFDSTYAARVVVSDKEAKNFKNSVGILLSKQNGEWLITGETDPW